MKSILYLLVILLLYNTHVHAQIYNEVTVYSDTQFYSTDYVVVLKNGFPTTGGSPCDSPFWIGLNAVNGYKFKFSKPVSTIRLKVFAINAGEQIAIAGNATLFNLNSSHLSVYNCGTTNVAAASGGLLVHSTGTFSNATVKAVFPTPVDSVQIHHLNGFGGGATFTIGFIWDTAVTIKQPFNDTMLCAGSTVNIKYEVNTDFNSNNTFTAQLSDDTGSFVNPVNIGTRNSDTDGTITWVVPPTIKNGTGYRIRMVSSSPVRTSADNGKNIRIGNPDSAGITVTHSGPTCLGDSLVLDATCNVPGCTYQWAGPSNFSSTSAHATLYGVIGASSGNYYSTIRFYGCTVKDTIPVVVQASPSVPAISSNSPICARDTLRLTSNNSTSGVTYNWTGPNSFTSNLQNPAIGNTSTATAGTYTVIANLNGCKRSNTVNVVVNASPAIVAVSNNGPICAGDSLFLQTGISSTGVTYSWAGPNSFAATSQNTYIANSTTQATGWYIATLNLNGCLFKDSTYASVKATPATPGVSYNNPICVNETLNLTASSVSGTTYNWTGPNGFTSTLQNPSRANMQAADAGTYSISTLINGCPSAPGNVQVTVNPLPFVIILASPGDTICPGSPVLFTTLPNNIGGTPQFRWYVNGTSTGSSGAIFNTTTLNNADAITCRMTENTKCSVPYTDESNDIKITVLPWLPPSVSITANPHKTLDPDEFVTFTATPVNGGIAPSYQWKRNGNDIVGATSYQWGANTLNDYDLVTVEMHSSYRCPLPAKATSNGIALHILTGIGDPDDISSIVLYPSPNNGNFVLSGNIATREELKIEVINTMGQVVYKDIVPPVNNYLNHSIQIDNAASGVYFMKISAGTQVAITRFNIN